MAQKPSRRQPTAAQLMDRKQHELYFQQMRELEHRKKLDRVHQLEVMWEAEDRVQQKRVTRLLREEEHEQRLEEAVRKVGAGGERRGRGWKEGEASLVSSGSCSRLSSRSLHPPPRFIAPQRKSENPGPPLPAKESILAEESKRLKDLELQQEEKLATELARLNHDKLKDEKMRQQIKENSIELRELERKLKSAYMNKERAVQIAEKEALKYEKMVTSFME
ncbi:Meiosis-specific nuclear structural protein 1, partial [Ophiophagus hannah]